MDHAAALSNDCKQDIERYLQARQQAALRGGGALSSFGGLNAIGPPIPLFSYEGRYSPGANTASWTENKMNLSAPIYKSGQDTVAMSLAAGELHLGKLLVLDSGTTVPQDLYRFELGVQDYHQLENQKSWSGRASVGYAGDKPFETARDLTYSFNANYGFPGSGRGYWILSVFFSNNSPIGNFVPIPGFGYLYRSNSFTGLFGFPITAIQWTPAFPWVFSMALFGPTIQAEAAVGTVDHLQSFLGYYWTRQNYIPSERVNSDDRLTLEEMKVGVGLRTLLWSSILGEIQIGRTFERSIFIGEGVFNKDGGSTTLNPDWYVALSLKAKL